MEIQQVEEPIHGFTENKDNPTSAMEIQPLAVQEQQGVSEPRIQSPAMEIQPVAAEECTDADRNQTESGIQDVDREEHGETEGEVQNGDMEVEPKKTKKKGKAKKGKKSRAASKKRNTTAVAVTEEVDEKGSCLKFSVVPATREIRERHGVERVITPVRSSQRLARRHKSQEKAGHPRCEGIKTC
jgi:hypothetical protein